MAGNVDRVTRAALWVMLMLSIVSSWYPFALDLPKRVVNSAVQRPDGAWDLDGDSLVIARAPKSVAILVAQQRFSMAIEARPAIADQSGPARLVSIGHDPYAPGLMVGIDNRDIVVYLPCDGTAANENAAWRFPLDTTREVAVALWFEGATAVPSIQVGDRPPVPLANGCPAGSTPVVPDAAQPWALGNVYSGHRPFAGRVLKLEMAGSGRRVDLLREVPWQVPEVYWRWPERLYQRPNGMGDELVAASWHFVSFAVLGCFAGAACGRRRAAPQLFVAVLIFAVVLNGGKVLIANRHPAVIDLLINIVGAAIGLYAMKRSTTLRKSISRTADRSCD